MQIKQRDGKQKSEEGESHRPLSLGKFIGQEHIKSIIQTAMQSAQKSQHCLGHILLSGPSGYGKTTLAHITTHMMGVNFMHITAYAITKPADIISLLQKLQSNDILFIDEIHRIKSNLEEILYIAMEDFRIDIIMPDGTNLDIPVNPFTLIGATTKPEQLSTPLKNRFVYSFHLSDYNLEEKQAILHYHLQATAITYDPSLLVLIANKIDTTPRNIKNFCIKIRDYMIAHNQKILNKSVREECSQWIDTDDGGLTQLHKKYLSLFHEKENLLGLKTIAAKLGVNEKTIEEDIEPLLLKLGLIQRTPRGRSRETQIIE